VTRALSTCEVVSRPPIAAFASGYAAPVSTTASTTRIPAGRRLTDRLGDQALYGLSALASVAAVVLILLVIYRIVDSASPAISKEGLGFLGHQAWNGTTIFGAGSLIYGTLVTTTGALLIAAPLGIAIGLYLSLLTSRRTAAILGPLVELLAAVPSVIIGLWGIVVLDPIMRSTIEPALHNTLGFIPLFGAPSLSGAGIFTAIVILAIMALPIIAAITRDLFLTVPAELKDGALALGATQWEMVRGVVLGSMRPGIVSACILGAGRAIGEAIAVVQVIGSVYQIHPNLFDNGNTLAAVIALHGLENNTTLETGSIFYLGVILLVFELFVNLAAQAIVRYYRIPDIASGAAAVAVDLI
jgi:phosphate transport system permease protein